MITKQVKKLRSCFWSTNDDFFADRICYRYTALILIASAVVIALATSHSNDDLSVTTCWCPAHFTSSHVAYTNKVCGQKFITNHIVGPNASAKQLSDEALKSAGGIHQESKYLPLVLVVLAVLIILPRLLWTNLSCLIGYSTETAVKALQDYSKIHLTPETLSQKLRPIAAQAMHAMGNSLPLISLSYLLTKSLYFVVIIAQIVALNCLVTIRVSNIGALFADDIPDAEPFNCTFEIMRLGQINRYVVQCIGSDGDAQDAVVTGTVVFLHLWLYCCLAAISLSTLLWVKRLCSNNATSRAAKAQRVCTLLGSPGSFNESALMDFTDKYLNADCTLLLKIVEENVSLTAASELVTTMWEMYEEKFQSNGKDAKLV